MNDRSEVKNRVAWATELLSSGDAAGCLSLLDGDEEERCDDGAVWQLRGLAYFELRDIPAAVLALERACLLVPLSPIAQLRLAESYIKTRRREVAVIILSHLGTLEALPEDIAVSVTQGLNRVGQCELALQFGLDSLRRFRSSHRLLFSVAKVMWRLNYSADDVLPFAYQAHHIRPGNLRYRIFFAQLLLRAKRPREAARLLIAVELEQVDCIASLERMGLLLQQLHEFTALRYCRARLQQIGYELGSRYRPRKNTSNVDEPF